MQVTIFLMAQQPDLGQDTSPLFLYSRFWPKRKIPWITMVCQNWWLKSKDRTSQNSASERHSSLPHQINSWPTFTNIIMPVQRSKFLERMVDGVWGLTQNWLGQDGGWNKQIYNLSNTWKYQGSKSNNFFLFWQERGNATSYGSECSLLCIFFVFMTKVCLDLTWEQDVVACQKWLNLPLSVTESNMLVDMTWLTLVSASSFETLAGSLNSMERRWSQLD